MVGRRGRKYREERSFRYPQGDSKIAQTAVTAIAPGRAQGRF